MDIFFLQNGIISLLMNMEIRIKGSIKLHVSAAKCRPSYIIGLTSRAASPASKDTTRIKSGDRPISCSWRFFSRRVKSPDVGFSLNISGLSSQWNFRFCSASRACFAENCDMFSKVRDERICWRNSAGVSVCLLKRSPFLPELNVAFCFIYSDRLVQFLYAEVCSCIEWLPWGEYYVFLNLL